MSSQAAVRTKAHYLCMWKQLTVLYSQLLMNEPSVIVSVSNKTYAMH